MSGSRPLCGDLGTIGLSNNEARECPARNAYTHTLYSPPQGEKGSTLEKEQWTCSMGLDHFLSRSKRMVLARTLSPSTSMRPFRRNVPRYVPKVPPDGVMSTCVPNSSRERELG